MRRLVLPGRLGIALQTAAHLVPHLTWVVLATLLVLAAVLVASGDAASQIASDATVQTRSESVLAAAAVTRGLGHEAIVVGRAREQRVVEAKELEDAIADLRISITRLGERVEALARVRFDVEILSSYQRLRGAGLTLGDSLAGRELAEAELAYSRLMGSHQELEREVSVLSREAGEGIVVAGEGLGAVTTAARFMVALVIPVVALLLFHRRLRAAHRRRLMEAELERHRTLSRERDRFLAAVSHHLNTPLAAVVGFAQLLRDRSRSFNAGARNEIIELLAIQAEETAKVVDDLLISARLQLDELTVERDDVDLRQVVDKVVEGWEGADRARLTVRGDAFATGDPRWIGQVLRNLFHNALVYGAGEIEVRLSTAFHWAFADVCDDGEKVPSEEVERIFEPYYTGINDRGPAPSLGLGLTVARRLARTMGGDVDYVEEGGAKGFRLTLPGGRVPDRPAPADLRFGSEEDSPTAEMVVGLLQRGGPTMVYQPIVEMTADPPRVVGYEALARFPTGGPWDWLRASSRAGLRLDLEVIAIRNAVAGFIPPNPEAFLTVNLSEPVLSSSRLLEALAGVDPARVVLELSEVGVIRSYEAVRGAVEMLTDRGYRLALDDVGAGEIDLWHVIRLRPAMIKLDMSLVRDLPGDPRDRALVHAIVSLASDLGITVVAEGIETEEERRHLGALAVRLGQGYLLGRPRPLRWETRVLADD